MSCSMSKWYGYYKNRAEKDAVTATALFFALLDNLKEEPMVFEISEYYTGGKIRLKPRVELYDTRDYMGKQMPGLAIVLDEVDQNENVTEQYAVLTVSFGDFLTLKNCAFIDTNNCPFAPQLLSDEIAQDTGHSKISGYCEYPLWVFKEDFLREIGGEKYEQYSEQFDAYMRREMSEDDMKMDEMCGM